MRCFAGKEILVLSAVLLGCGGPDAGVSDAQAAADAGVIEVVQIAVGGEHTCALLSNGRVRCWGTGPFYSLGYGNTDTIGDDEQPAAAGDIDLGGTATRITAGRHHSCALLTGGQVRCWGFGGSQLGYGNGDTIGDDELPSSAGDLELGGTAVAVVAGYAHTCVQLATGGVKCWGDSQFGQLGYGNTDTIGDDELPSLVGEVPLGAAPTKITTQEFHSCALSGGALRCWGENSRGQLGYGSTQHIGDDELPSSAGEVDVSAEVVDVSVGGSHTCAVLANASLRCWGWARFGQLGYGDMNQIGDDELPATAGDVSVGDGVTQVATGFSHTCSLSATGAVRCWGQGAEGRLGYGNERNIGDDELPSSVGLVDIGGAATQLVAGDSHTCVLLTTGAVRCWGEGQDGKLGYANTENIGDNETPASAGDLCIIGTETSCTN